MPTDLRQLCLVFVRPTVGRPGLGDDVGGRAPRSLFCTRLGEERLRDDGAPGTHPVSRWLVRWPPPPLGVVR